MKSIDEIQRRIDFLKQIEADCVIDIHTSTDNGRILELYKEFSEVKKELEFLYWILE